MHEFILFHAVKDKISQQKFLNKAKSSNLLCGLRIDESVTIYALFITKAA